MDLIHLKTILYKGEDIVMGLHALHPDRSSFPLLNENLLCP